LCVFSLCLCAGCLLAVVVVLRGDFSTRLCLSVSFLQVLRVCMFLEFVCCREQRGDLTTVEFGGLFFLLGEEGPGRDEELGRRRRRIRGEKAGENGMIFVAEEENR